MQSAFVLLLALCGLAAALPRNEGLTETELEEAKRLKICTSGSPRLKGASEIHTSSSSPSQSHVITIKDAADLTTKLSQVGDKVVVIFIMDEWCYYSRRIIPAVEEIANRKEDVVVLKVVREDINTEDDWKYGVSDYHRVPTFIFVKNGEKVEEFTGSLFGRLRRTTSRLTAHSTTSITTTTAATVATEGA